jgi:hypothetical protein
MRLHEISSVAVHAVAATHANNPINRVWQMVRDFLIIQFLLATKATKQFDTAQRAATQ